MNMLIAIPFNQIFSHKPMLATLDCVLCLIRQSLSAARFATKDVSIHTAILKQTLDVIREKGFPVVTPLLAQEIHHIVQKETGITDPYVVQKQEANSIMLGIMDSLRDQIRQSSDPLLFAIKVAIAGNSIDYVISSDWNQDLLLHTFEQATQQPINGDIERFVEVIKNAKQIMYLLDNCGEIVCDQLLIEEIKRLRPDLPVIGVVHGSAVLNDVTREDARQTGFDEAVSTIDNGNDAIGTILEQCGAEFMEAFGKSDTIIVKGMANYETLIEYNSEQLPQTVCYLFRAKCPIIAKHVGAATNDLIVRVK